jgi:hypothetical protein
MKYNQCKTLVEELVTTAIIFHASPSRLREKIAAAIDVYIPDLDPSCMARGCTCIDDFKKKNEQAKNT